MGARWRGAKAFARSMSSASAGRAVYVAGQGIVPVSRKTSRSLREMGGEAVRKAVSESGIDPAAVQGIYVGNMLAGMLSQQQHIGVLLATHGGWVVDDLTSPSISSSPHTLSSLSRFPQIDPQQSPVITQPHRLPSMNLMPSIFLAASATLQRIHRIKCPIFFHFLHPAVTIILILVCWLHACPRSPGHRSPESDGRSHSLQAHRYARGSDNRSMLRRGRGSAAMGLHGGGIWDVRDGRGRRSRSNDTR